MTLAQRAVRGTVFVLASSYANMALGIIYGIVMARLLEPDHFGVFALALFFCTLIDARGKLGLDYAFIHRQATTAELCATHWLLQVGAATLTLGLVATGAMLITHFHYPPATAPVMIAIAGAMVIEAMGTTARAALEKELVFARSTVVVTGALLLSYAGAIALALAGFTYGALVGQAVLNALFGSVGFWGAFRPLAPRAWSNFRFDRAIASWMLRFGAVMSVGAIATALLLQFDNFLVGTLVSTAALGYYALAYKMAQWPTGLVTHIVSRTALPTYAKLQDDPPRLSKSFGMTLWLILTLATPLALAIFVSAPDLIVLLYGEKWLPSAALLRFLIVYSVLRPLLDDAGALFTAIGQPRRITLVLGAQAVILIVAATPLTLALGTSGTAIGVGIAFACGIVLAYHLVARAIPLDLARLFLPALVAALGSTALYLALARGIDLNVLPLLVRVMVKSGFVVGAFLTIALLTERHALIDRVGYIWRLLRSSAA